MNKEQLAMSSEQSSCSKTLILPLRLCIFAGFSLLLTLCSLLFVSCKNPLMEKVFGLSITSFDSNGGSAVASQQLLRGETVERPDNPVKTDLVFGGWFEDNNSFENEWNFNVPPDRELTLFANWLNLQITLDPNEIEFDSLIAGYDLSELTAHEITVMNTGSQPTGELLITISGAYSTVFSVSANVIAELQPGESESFTVIPIVGLSSNTYTATVNVTGLNIAASVNLSFIVEQVIEDPGTATITLSVEQITDGTPNINETITLSRTGTAPFEMTRQITLSNPGDYDTGSIHWEIAGAGIIYAGPAVTGTGASFTLDATDTRYNVIGGNTLILRVTIAGILYQKNIFFTVMN